MRGAGVCVGVRVGCGWGAQVLEEYEALEKGNVAHRLYSSSLAGNKARPRAARRARAAA